MSHARLAAAARLRRLAICVLSSVALLVSGAVIVLSAAADDGLPEQPPTPDPAVVLADWGTAPLPYEVDTAWESDGSEQAVLVVKLMNLDDVAVRVTVDSPFGPSKEPVVVPVDESRELRILAGRYHVAAGSLTVEVRDAVWGTADPLLVEADFAAFSALRPPRGDAESDAWVDPDDGLVRIGGSFTNTGPHPVLAQLHSDAHGASAEHLVAPGATAHLELSTGQPSVPPAAAAIVATKTVDGETLSSRFELRTPATVNEPPSVGITDPGIGADVIGRFGVSGTVTDDYGLRSDEVTARLLPVRPDGEVGPVVETVVVPVADGVWSATFDALDLPAGSYRVAAVTTDNAGQESAGEGIGRRDLTVLDAPDHRPGVAVLADDNSHDGVRGGHYTVTANLWWGQNGTTFRLYENGELAATRTLVDASPAAQSLSVPVADKPNGTYVYTCEMENARGVTDCGSHTVKVVDAAPAVPGLSSDNWDGDGDFTVTANLWWGTNATSWTLFEDGVAIASGDLVAATPAAQQVTVPLTERTPGTHAYRIEFANALGATTSRDLEVRVR